MRDVHIALALGSGAARGWAHIGVIKALQEMNLKVNIVGGTSIGSLVGAGFACGRMDELETWVRSMGRWQVWNLLDFGLSSGGLVVGERVFNHAREQFGATNIEDLEMTYGAVSTDLYTGREIWLRHGDIFDASRASCAMPGLLSPARHDDRWLVDGGLVNPVPISLTRALGADFVIAVHLNSQLNTRVGKNSTPRNMAPQAESEKVATEVQAEQEQKVADEHGFFQNIMSQSAHYWDEVKQKLSGPEHKSPGVFGVMAGAIDIMQERITKARMAGDPPDVLIQPKLGHIGILEFDRGNEAIDIGYETTIRMRDLIESEIELFNDRVS